MTGLRRLFAFMRPYRRPLIAAVVLTGGLTLIGMAPPLLMRRLLNDVARQGRWDLLWLVLGLLLAVPVLRAIVNVANSFALNYLSLRIVGDTRKRMFRHLMRLSMRFYGEMPVGGINQRLMADVGNISGVATGGVIALVSDILAVAFAVIVMLRLSWSLSTLTFALLPLYYLNTRFFSKRLHAANALLRSRMDHISSMLQERLSAHELIQAYGQEEEQSTAFDSQAKQIMDAAVKGDAYNITFNQLAAFITKLGNTLIYGAGCYYFVKGWLGYGDVVAFCAYATQLLGPIVRFSAVASQIKQVGVSIDRIEEILNREPAIREDPEALPVTALKGDVLVDGVSFTYGDQAAALTDLHLEIPAGTNVALLGATGAGRTTLAMVLRRFYDPEAGTVHVDGVDIRRYRLREYREALAMILPESAIFDGTIRENLLYGKPTASDERMVEVARAVGLNEFVEGFEAGYNTVVGTGGVRLSAGIQQQIGIARALISEPLVLIVDEATTVLDPDTAERVNQAILGAMEGKTCLLIVHRALMAKLADEVAVMQGGQLVEKGSPDNLIRRPDGLYRSIFATQYGRDRLPPAEEEHS